MKLKFLIAATILPISGTITPASAATNLIDATYGPGAGSFELGSFTPIGAGNLVFQSLTPGATNITGWSIGGVGIDWLSTPYYGANQGIHAIDLGYNGLANALGAGAITTVISTSVGATYNLRFAAAAVSGFPAYTNGGLVNAGSLVNQVFAPAFTPTPNDFANQVYTDYNFNFTAVSNSTAITFNATDPNSAYGPVIDNVSVIFVGDAAVPEPATWATTLAGFALIGGALRGKRKQAAIA